MNMFPNHKSLQWLQKIRLHITAKAKENKLNSNFPLVADVTL